jgi:hypothetical protein
VLDPFDFKLNEAVDLFEVIFVRLVQDNDVDVKYDSDIFSESLVIKDGKMFFAESFINKFNGYISKYSLVTNEDYLLLNSWKEIEITR